MSPSDDGDADVGTPGDWVCCCTEGLEEVSVEEIAQLGGSARIIGDGVVIVSATSMPPDVVLRVRSVETIAVLVGTLTLTGEASHDLDVFKTLCHPTAGAWGAKAPSRWSAAAVAWVRARRAAMLRHGLGLGEVKEGPAPEESMTWDAAEDVRVKHKDGRLARRGAAPLPDGEAGAGRGGGGGAGGESCGDDGGSDRGRCSGGGSGGDGSGDGSDAAAAAAGHSLSFRVCCVRSPGTADGGIKHGYKSIDVNHELGWSLSVTHPSWSVDLTRPTLTVEVVVKGRFAAVTLRAAAAAESRRMRWVARTATTRPHLAAAMIRLAEPALGEVIVDIGCGMGTVMSEAAQHNCHLRYPTSLPGGGSREEGGGGGRVVLGGDVVFCSAALAADNLAAAAAAAGVPSLCCDVCAWSMEHLPLRTASQDIVTCDLPFGKAHLDARTISRLYPAALRQISRVLRVGGRAVLMGVRTRFNNILLHGVVPLEIRYQRLVDKGGLKVALYVLQRVEEEEWDRRKGALGGGSNNFDILMRNKRGEAHAERSRQRAAARLARGETVGAPTFSPPSTS